MSDQTPTEAAMDAYSDAIRVELGHAPSQYGREQDRALLHANPAIKAMLDAHERAVLLAAGQKLRDRAAKYAADYPGQHPAQLAYHRHMLTAARVIEPEPTDDEIRTGLAELLGGMAVQTTRARPLDTANTEE